MPLRSRLRLYTKLSIIVIAVTLAGYFVSLRATTARIGGPDPGFTGAPGENDCTACHGDFALNGGPGSVQINRVPDNYAPNQVVPITVKLKHGGASRFGFQLTALDEAGNPAGTLVATDALQTQLRDDIGTTLRTYIQHKFAGTAPTVAGEKEWTFNWVAPATRVGRVSFYVGANGGNSDQSPTGDYVYATSARIGSAPADFDGDGKTDLSVFRNGDWYIQRSTAGFAAYAFGVSSDRVVPGDYDGDNKADVAVFRPATGDWYYLRSSDGAFRAVQFGNSSDVPVAADFDGDGKADIAVYRASAGSWYYLRSSDGAFRATAFGSSEDRAVPQDYDGDGKTDIAVFRPSNGFWYYLQSTDGAFGYAQFGLGTDTPVSGDYDGDGRADLAVFRSSTGEWYIQNSSNGDVVGQQFGLSTDRPAPANYDGDSKTDIAVFRQLDGGWYVLNSTNGAFSGTQFGTNGDISVPSAFVP